VRIKLDKFGLNEQIGNAKMVENNFALRFQIVAYFFLFFITPMVHAQSFQGESLFMECSVGDQDRQVSVTFNGEVAYYRFGQIGQAAEIELSIPYISLLEQGRLHYGPSGHSIKKIAEKIEFVNGEYSYAVTMGLHDAWIEPRDWDDDDFGKIFTYPSDNYERFGSVVVEKNGIVLAILTCQPKSITWNYNTLHKSLYGAGFKWGKIDSGPPVWFYDYNDKYYPHSGLPKSVASFFCPYSDKKPINFSSWVTQDTLSIEVVGDDCDTADIVMVITTAAGDVIHSSSARALSYTYEYQGADGVRAMLMEFMQNQPSNGFDVRLPSYDEIQSNSVYFNVNGPLLKRVQRFNYPLFCHQTAKTVSSCFVYADGQSTLLFSTGS
jgi:hypothetical protein